MTTCRMHFTAAQAAIASQLTVFRMCYGPEYVSDKLMEWTKK